LNVDDDLGDDGPAASKLVRSSFPSWDRERTADVARVAIERMIAVA
jgi:hypothetical protein